MTDEKIFNMEFEAEEKKNKAKEFLSRNKWKIAGGAAAIVLTVIVGKKVVKANSHKDVTDIIGFPTEEVSVIAKANKEDIPFDYGRDCVMKFFVEDTGEFLGEAFCTESYAKDMIDSFNELSEE